MRERIITTYQKGSYYHGSGLVLFLDKHKAEIFRYSHCSCYGIEEAIGNSLNESPIWDGNITELFKLVINKRDPNFPSRNINSKDFDKSMLGEFYAEIEDWGLRNKYLRYDRNCGGKAVIIN